MLQMRYGRRIRFAAVVSATRFAVSEASAGLGPVTAL